MVPFQRAASTSARVIAPPPATPRSGRRILMTVPRRRHTSQVLPGRELTSRQVLFRCVTDVTPTTLRSAHCVLERCFEALCIECRHTLDPPQMLGGVPDGERE